MRAPTETASSKRTPYASFRSNLVSCWILVSLRFAAFRVWRAPAAACLAACSGQRAFRMLACRAEPAHSTCIAATELAEPVSWYAVRPLGPEALATLGTT